MNTPKGFIDDSIIALLKDEEALKGLEACNSPEEAYAVVKDKVTVSFEEFQSMMNIAKELTDELSEGLLSENDLEAIAGGKSAAAQTASDIAIGVAGMGFFGAAGAAAS